MITSTGESIAPATTLIFRDGAQELGAWLDVALAEIDADGELSPVERDAARLLTYQDLGRRASRVLAGATGEDRR